MPKTIICSEERCQEQVRRWRSCGWQYNCHIEIGFCDDHGGDARAVREMIAHTDLMHVRKP